MTYTFQNTTSRNVTSQNVISPDHTISLDLRRDFGGSIRAISSKSHVHRCLIAAALSDAAVKLQHVTMSKDIYATINCLTGLGAEIICEDNHSGDSDTGHCLAAGCDDNSEGALCVSPTLYKTISDEALPSAGYIPVDCGESGSTLRFMLPLIGVLGLSTAITMHGRLSERPLSPLYEELASHGAAISPVGTNPLLISGKLSGGDYIISGNVSSQYITGLLMALPLCSEDSRIIVTEGLASKPYIDITLDVLRRFGITVNIYTPDSSADMSDYISSAHYSLSESTADSSSPIAAIYEIPGRQTYHGPSVLDTDGDWSNAAFFLSAGAIGSAAVTVTGLSYSSPQGDKRIADILQSFGANIQITDTAVTVGPSQLTAVDINAEDIPDLVPIISLVATQAEGTTLIRNVERLRIKESDRVSTTIETIRVLGGDIHDETIDGHLSLIIKGKTSLTGGVADSHNDHRIAMTAAIASLMCPVTITNCMAVTKSYPDFYRDLMSLS